MTLPPGTHGISFAGSPAVVSSVHGSSPLSGIVFQGERVTGLLIPGAVELTNGCPGDQLASILDRHADVEGRTLLLTSSGAPDTTSKATVLQEKTYQVGIEVGDVPQRSPGTMHPLAWASIFVWALMVVLGIVAFAKATKANAPGNENWEADGQAARSSGAVAILCAASATPLAYGAAVRYRGRAQVALMIVSWIFYGVSLVNAVAIFALAFVPEVHVPAGVILGQVVLASLGWALMFAFSEAARRAA